MCPFQHKDILIEIEVTNSDEKQPTHIDSNDEEEIDFDKFHIAENVTDIDLHPFRCQKCKTIFENQTNLL